MKPDKFERERRKELLRRIADEQRSQARAALPIDDDLLQAMFDTLDRALPAEGCDHTRRLTRRFLDQRGLAVEPVFAWLDENGGICDCEVLSNTEEQWQNCRDQG